MRLDRATNDDVAVICNYVTDELHQLGFMDTYGMSVHIEAALKDSEVWKVVTDDGLLVAFGAVEDVNPTTLHVISYYIAKPYRQTIAAYLISKKMLELMEPYHNIVYIPLAENQQLPTRFCRDNRIDKVALKQFIERFDKRWEVAQKQ